MKNKILLYGLLLLVAGLFVTQTIAQKKTKPNIIFILTDDLGYGDVGAFFQKQRELSGDKSKPFLLSPNIDALAKNGAMLTQQYCNAPVCAPSRASIYTGVGQGNALVRDNQFDKALENNHTIATMLKQAGYATSLVGKWGLQGKTDHEPDWPAHPLKRGFDDYFGYMRHADGHEHYPYEGVYRGKKQVWHNNTNIAAELEKCYTTDLWTAYAKKWITDHEQKNAGQPFFMFLAYDAPHAVLELPTGAYPAGKGLKGGLQWLNKPGQMINSANGEVDSYFYPEYANATYDDDKNPGTPEKAWPETYKRYATAARRIDDGIGDIMQLLKDLKIDENTMVVFASDNGPSIESYLPKEYVPYQPTFFSSYGPFDGIKRDCWEGGVRMPSIATWPKHITAGKQITVASMLSDWAATFADIAGVPKPERMDGISLAPSLLNKGVQKTGQVYVEYFEGGKTPAFNEFEASRRGRKRDQMQMIRLGNYAGVRYQVKSAEDDFEIYDVIKDPKEATNLAGLPGFEKLQQQMKAKVLQIHKADSESVRPYDRALVPSVQPAVSLSKGINWQFFPGNFPWVVSEDGLKASSKGHATALSAAVGPDISGMILFEGYINIPADGEYLFSFTSSQKAYIRLHEAELFDADYGYRPGTALTHKVYLKAGYHPVKIYALRIQHQKSAVKLFVVSANNQQLAVDQILYGQ